MKKLLLFLIATFITSLSVVAENVVCDFTVKNDWNGVSSYTSNFTSKDGKWIVYNANNNASKNVPQWDYIRIGAKKSSASSANVVSVCKIQTKTAIAESIDEVVINVVKGTLTSSTVDEIKVIVSDDATFDEKDQAYTATTLPNKTTSTGEFSVAIKNPVNNKYYSLEITVTNKTTSAGVIDVNKVTLKESVGNDKSKPKLAFEQTEYTATLGDDEFVSPQLVKQETDGKVTYTSSNPEVATIDAETAKLTLLQAGTTIITATSAETDTYAAGSASYTLTVVDPTVRYTSAIGEDFTFENISLGSLSYVWTCDKSNSYLKASAYVGNKSNAAEAIAWSPVLDLTNYRDLTLTFSAAYNFFGSLDAVKDYVSIVAREEGETEWTPIEAEITTADKLGWTFVDNAAIDLSAYSNTKMQFGFKYVSTSSVAGTWEVKNIVLRGKEGVVEKTPVLKVTASDGQKFEADGDYEIVAGTAITATAGGAETITIVEADSEINISGTDGAEWTPEAGVYNPVITATNNIGSSSIEFILTVKDDAKLAFAADAAVTGYAGEELNGLLIAENPHNVEVTYESNNGEVVGVSTDGSTLMLFAEGTAEITAISNDIIYGGKASYTVTVLPGLGEITVNGKTVAEDESIVVYEGSKVVFAAENATSIVAIYADDEDIDEVSASGSELEWIAELGEYTFNVEATLSTLSTSKDFTIKVDEAPQISTTTLTAADFGIVGATYTDYEATIDDVTFAGCLGGAFPSGVSQNGAAYYISIRNSNKDGKFGGIAVTVNDTKVCTGVTITQSSIQTAERKAFVYGSYDAYETGKGINTDNLPEGSVKLGEATMKTGEAVSITFADETPYYPYIIILANGALQMSQIDIEWTKRFDMPMVEHVHTGKLSEGGYVTFTLSHGKNANARIFHQHEPKAPAAVKGLRVPSLSSDKWTEASFDDREITINSEGKFHVYASDASGKNRSAVVTAIVEDTKTTSISEVVAEGGEAEYFDLQGRRIAAPVKGALYLLKQGSKVSKRVL